MMNSIYFGVAIFFTLMTFVYIGRNMIAAIMGYKKVDGMALWISVGLASLFWALWI